MNNQISTRWVIATNIGVLVGLISVIFQLIEDRNLLRVSLTNDYYSSYIQADTIFAGENLPAVFEKAHVDPKNLSISEMRIMEAQTFSPINRWINLYRMSEAGIVDDKFWKTQIDLDATFYLGSPYGRAYWEISSPLWSSDFLPDAIRKRVEERLYDENIQPNSNYTKNYYEDIKNAISEN